MKLIFYLIEILYIVLILPIRVIYACSIKLTYWCNRTIQDYRKEIDPFL